LRTHAIPERLRSVITTRRYTIHAYLYLYLLCDVKILSIEIAPLLMNILSLQSDIGEYMIFKAFIKFVYLYVPSISLV